MRHFVITEFVSLFYVYDFKGQKKEFLCVNIQITVKRGIHFAVHPDKLIPIV